LELTVNIEAARSFGPSLGAALEQRSSASGHSSILIVPGINGSGPGHWQSHWERTLPGAERVEQFEWARPRLADWVAGLAEAVRRRPGALIVAHSLGCALVAHWARITGGRVVAASHNDPYVTIERAEGFARAWGSAFVNLGAQGHINVASGHGPWPEGAALLEPFTVTLIKSVR
jgi:predicted alpha/beta hydrolase family esterase